MTTFVLTMFLSIALPFLVQPMLAQDGASTAKAVWIDDFSSTLSVLQS